MKLKLLEIIKEAEGTKSFIWQPENEFDFKPGQYFYYTIPELKFKDDRGNTRHFTISSSPTENNLMLTTRIRDESGYKKTLDQLAPGAVIEGEGPSGTFIFEGENIGTQIFLAGGIGITPFRSMIKFALDKNFKTPLRLIYSNSNSEFTFRKELDKWSHDYDLKVDYINTSDKGRLDGKGILNSIKNWGLENKNPTIWIVGPPGFVNTLEDIVEELDITDSIKSEKFTGY